MKSGTSTPPTKDDVLAILKAHRDLGPEFDSHLADQILDLWHFSGARRGSTRPVVSTPMAGEREGRSGLHRAIPLLKISIPILAIAGWMAHGPGVMAVLGLDTLVIVLASIFG